MKIGPSRFRSAPPTHQPCAFPFMYRNQLRSVSPCSNRSQPGMLRFLFPAPVLLASFVLVLVPSDLRICARVPEIAFVSFLSLRSIIFLRVPASVSLATLVLCTCPCTRVNSFSLVPVRACLKPSLKLFSLVNLFLPAAIFSRICARVSM